MKKIVSVLAVLVIILALGGCGSSGEKVDISGKYTASSVVSIGSVEENSTDKVKVTYTIEIKGNSEDIAKLKKHKVLLSEEAEKRFVETQDEKTENADGVIKVNGVMIFNTSDMTVDEINNVNFIQGVEVADSDGNVGTVKL